MRQKEQNKPKEKRSTFHQFKGQEAVYRNLHYQYRIGKIQMTPDLQEWIDQKKRNVEMNELLVKEKWRKIWADVKLFAGQCFWHRQDNWHCLIVSVDGKEEKHDIPYVHVWVFKDGEFSDEQHPEAVFRKKVFAKEYRCGFTKNQLEKIENNG